MSDSANEPPGAKPLDLTEFGDISGVYTEPPREPPAQDASGAPAQQNLGALTGTKQPLQPSLAPPRKRRRWGRILRDSLLSLLILGAVSTGVLWWAVHTFDWAGPLVADTLRALIGVDNVTRLEDFAYAVEDRYNRWAREGEAPRAYWEVPPEPSSAVVASASAGAGMMGPPPFHLADVGPVHTSWSAPGDGKWVPIVDPKHPGESPHMYKTLLHPDRNRSWAEVFVVAIDLRRSTLHMVPGYQEPKSETPEAKERMKERTEARSAVIPSKHHEALLAAFNGGFKTEHGHFGMMVDGLVVMPPRERACLLAMFTTGELEVRDWEVLKGSVGQMTWYRQTPNCMYERGKMHPLLSDPNATTWGATLDKETVIRRSAIGLNEARDVLFVSITNATTAQAIAQGMRHAGAADVAQLDVNWSYPKFLLYPPEYEGGPRKAVALAEGFEFDPDEYIRKRAMRDFFYVTRKPDAEVTAWMKQRGSAPPAPAPSSSGAPSGAASAAGAPSAKPR